MAADQNRFRYPVTATPILAVQPPMHLSLTRNQSNTPSAHRRPGVRVTATLILLAVFPIPYATANGQGDKPVTTLTQPRPGTFLPVQLGRSLRAGKTKPGTVLVAKTTQRIPTAEHLFLPRGTVVGGQVLISDAGDGSPAHPPRLTVQFTSLTCAHQTVPIRTEAVALANFTDVAETSAPATDFSDRGNPSAANWTTQQIGGDLVVRSGWVGPVTNSVMQTVGFADYNGVYTLPHNRTSSNGTALPLALGVFSTSAKGLYGFDDGSTLLSKDGSITIQGSGKVLVLYGNDNLLLRVVPGEN